LRLGGGIVHRTAERLALVGELDILTEFDTVRLGGGVATIAYSRAASSAEGLPFA
jgi:hypothetical protein